MASMHLSKRIVSGKVLSVALVAVAFLLGVLIGGGGGDGSPEDPAAKSAQQGTTTWTCSMHPQIQLPKPGKCPICFMDLIPVEAGGENEPGPRSLILSEAAAALAEIQTVPVQRRPVVAEIRLTGKVDYDERRTRTISAWVPGRIDTLYVDITGSEVHAGDRLVSIYSPELYAAQTELLGAIEAERELRASDNGLMRRTAAATIESARERLRLWGLTGQQVAALESRGVPSHHLTIRSPLGGIVVHKNAVEGMYVQTGSRIYTVADLSSVWVTLDAYESDLAWLHRGQTVDFTVAALPGATFSGSIVFIDPILDEKTRTVTVRLDVKNTAGRLKPGMFVHATARAGASNEGADDRMQTPDAGPLIIPASAPLITGERAVVYVRLPARENPTFEGREIVLGPRAGDSYLVESGLQEGELVVVKGNFKLDSALQIQAKPSMMNPTGFGSLPDHQHTAPAGNAAGSADTIGSEKAHRDRDAVEAESGLHRFEAPTAFLAQLEAFLNAYLEIQQSLAGDDGEAAGEAGRKAATALESVDMTLLNGPAHLAWMQDLGRLNQALTALVSADGIADRRDAFLPLSEALWDAMRRFDRRGDRTVRLFHCPMANGGAGADWIQLEATTANPYYGAAMPRCGSQTDSLGAAVPVEGGRKS